MFLEAQMDFVTGFTVDYAQLAGLRNVSELSKVSTRNRLARPPARVADWLNANPGLQIEAKRRLVHSTHRPTTVQLQLLLWFQ
jgi:hypothetical protein